MTGNPKETQWVQWVMAAFISIALAVSSYALTRLDNAVMKDDYRLDQARLERSIDCIAGDVKQILQRLPQNPRE